MARNKLLALLGSVCLILVLASLPFLAACPAPKPPPPAEEEEGQPIDLKVAHYMPLDSMNQEVCEMAADYVVEKTGGMVHFTYYPSNILLSAPALYEGTVENITDIAMVTPGFTPGRFPLTDVLDLPPGIPSGVEASVVYWDFYKKFLTHEWKDVKVLFVFVQPPQHIHTNKPVRTLDDIKGLQIRIYGVGKGIVESWGGIPVSMPISDAYEAIEKGIVDGIMTEWATLKIAKLADVTKCHTDLGVFAAPFFVIMNLEKYNGLPAKIKAAFDELGDVAPEGAGNIYEKWNAMGKALAEQPGHEIIELTPDQRAVWLKAAIGANEDWAEDLEALGLPAKKLLEEKYKAIEEFVPEEYRLLIK